MNFLKKLKKNYEKFLLGAVLIGLAVAIGLLPFKIASERSKSVELTSSIIHINVKELTNLDLSMPEAALKRAAAPVSLNFGEPHKLFNPVPWQKATDGHLIKVEAGNIGPSAVGITKLTPLYLKLTLDSVTVVDSPRYVIGIEKEAATNPSQRGKTQKYSKLNDKNEVFALREVQGPPDNPTNIVLELNDSGDRVSISKEQPFRRVDGYMADLKYSPETKTWTNRRVGQSIAFGGDDYKIVAINKDEVILLAPSGKKTSIKNNAAL